MFFIDYAYICANFLVPIFKFFMKNKASKYRSILALLAIVLTTFFSYANSDTQEDGRIDTKEKVQAYILHHIKDSHDFSLFSYTGDNGERHHFGFPLPIILWTSEGLVTFMSSEFHHNDDGHVIVEKKGLKFAKVHSKIYL